MNLATLITASRVAIAPIFAYVFINGYNSRALDEYAGDTWIYTCIALAVLIELSDLFDGMTARSRKEVTDFGKVFDPVADSVSRQTVFISFMITGLIPLWMYLIFFYRDAFMQLLRIVCASNGVVLAARMSGKIKAFLQGVATFAVLLILWRPDIFPESAVYWVMLATAVYTLISVVDYIIPNGKLIVEMMGRKK